MKTQDLIGCPLDWAVAKCEGLIFQAGAWYKPATEQLAAWRIADFAPSRHWAQGGPIIEREKIDTTYEPGDLEWVSEWFSPDEYASHRGPTPLIAAMRCYVASKLGEEIEIPEELLS